MQIIRGKTEREALEEVQRRRNTPEGAGLIYKIIKSRFGNGFDIVAMDPELYLDMLTGELPTIPQLRGHSLMGEVDS
ncbi:MAG: hypothetical protein F4X75_17490 [Gemmatimonadetes bacterium]|nr:hypothetical protein [Gemmatimonadota bacterium]MYB70280.1 hypothetical protein [Gemmatimonadota bacterium]